MNTAPLATFTRPEFKSRVVPVIVITHVDQAVPMAYALLEGGIDVMEITLRHAAGLAAIEAVGGELSGYGSSPPHSGRSKTIGDASPAAPM